MSYLAEQQARLAAYHFRAVIEGEAAAQTWLDQQPPVTLRESGDR